MSRQILAVDIRNDAIAGVLINMGLKFNTVSKTVHVPVEPSSEEDEKDPLVQAFLRLKEEIDPTGTNVLVALPPEGILYRQLVVPFKEDNKIKQVLPFELEPLLPINIDSLKIDYQKKQGAENTEILAVAIDQAELQRYMDALSEANIRPQLIVPGGLPLAQFLAGSAALQAEQMLVLDVEKDKTTLFAIDSGQVQLVRRFSTTIDSEQAAESLALRIRQTLTALSEQKDNYLVPSKVFMTGPGLDDPNIYKRIDLALELPTVNANVINMAPRLEVQGNLRWAPHVMNNALALVLLEADRQPCVNFHRTTSPLRNYWMAYRPYIMGPAIILAVVLLISIAGVIVDKVQLARAKKNIDAQMAQVYNSTFPGSKIDGEQAFKTMKSKIETLKGADGEDGTIPASVRTVDVLLQLSERIPKEVEVQFTQIRQEGASLSISGETAALKSLDTIKSSLEMSDVFKRVNIASTKMDKDDKKFRFKLKISL